MKIFVLEDDPIRIKHFEKIFKNYTTVIATNVEEAKNKIYEHEYNTIFLDHDLGGEQMIDSSKENSGYQFAKYIVESDDRHINAQIVIHSQNPVGALNMKRLFEYWKYEVVIKPYMQIYNETKDIR